MSQMYGKNPIYPKKACGKNEEGYAKNENKLSKHAQSPFLRFCLWGIRILFNFVHVIQKLTCIY